MPINWKPGDKLTVRGIMKNGDLLQVECFALSEGRNDDLVQTRVRLMDDRVVKVPSRYVWMVVRKAV